MAIVIQRTFMSQASDYLGNYSVYDKGLKLFANIQIVAAEVFSSLKYLKAVSVCQRLFNVLDQARSTINVLDFVGDIAGITDTSLGDVHVSRMNIAANAFFLIADTISPYLFFAEFGFYAIGEVVKKGLCTVAGTVGIVGSCVIIASACYQIYRAQDVTNNALTIVEKMADCAAGVLGFISIATFPPGLIIAASLYVTSSSIALIKIWYF